MNPITTALVNDRNVSKDLRHAINDISAIQFAKLRNPNFYLRVGDVVSRVDTLDRALLVSILPKAIIARGQDGVFTCTVRVVK